MTNKKTKPAAHRKINESALLDVSRSFQDLIEGWLIFSDAISTVPFSALRCRGPPCLTGIWVCATIRGSKQWSGLLRLKGVTSLWQNKELAGQCRALTQKKQTNEKLKDCSQAFIHRVPLSLENPRFPAHKPQKRDGRNPAPPKKP